MVGCVEGRTRTSEAADQNVGAVAAAVVGGQTTDACDWPSTVDVNGCTGTLIHPKVVTTAAHCLDWTNKVTFTAGKGISGSFAFNVQCQSGAFGSTGGGSSSDWAYCLLPDDPRIAQFPITPPLVGCEADKFLKVGASAWVVGFGATGSNRNDYGIKRAVEVKINAVRNGIVDIGDKAVGACHGDSGGPLYMRLGDDTHDWGWRVAGSTSSAGSDNCDCTCDTIYVDIKNHVKAIEANEKIDVTPCTDSSGAWSPTAACSGFISDPQQGTGTYPNCSVPKTTGPIETCGTSVGGGNAGVGGASANAGNGGHGGNGGNGGNGGTGASGSAAAGNGGQGGTGAGGTTGAGAGAAAAGAGGVAGGAGQSAAGSGVVTNGTTVNGSAGQNYVPGAGTSGVPAIGVAGSLGVPIDEGTGSHSSGGCSVAYDARSGTRGLVPVFMLLAWQLRRARRVRAQDRARAHAMG